MYAIAIAAWVISVVGLAFICWKWLVDRFCVEVTDFIDPELSDYPRITTVTAEVVETIVPGIRVQRTRQFEIVDGNVLENEETPVFHLEHAVRNALRNARVAHPRRRTA